MANLEAETTTCLTKGGEKISATERQGRLKMTRSAICSAKDYTIDCTGDVVVGDVIRFSEGVFSGNWKNPNHLGDRTIEGEVIADSYGAAKQQHTFTILVADVIGYNASKTVGVGSKLRRKGRNVYRNGTRRLAWPDEARRAVAADEKHARGDLARSDRQINRSF